MTIEEMIKSLNQMWLDADYDDAKLIIEALRAGQRMRKDAYSDEPGAQAWDAAVGEKE